MTRSKRVALLSVAGGTALIGSAYTAAALAQAPPSWTPPVFIVGTAFAMVGMMVLGAATDRGIGRLVLPLAFVWLLLVGGFGAVYIAPSVAAAGLWMGLPPAAAIVIYGIGLSPFLVLPLAYAMTFDSVTLRPGDVERVRAARAASAPEQS